MSAASCPGVTSTPAAQTSSEVPAPKLLPELFDQVIDHLHDDIPALTRCALVSREWTSTARYHRFNTLKVNLRYDDYTKLGEVLSASPEIRRLVRELWITTPWDDMETLTSPYLGPLTWLPVMEATEELVLKDHTLEDDEQLDYDFRPYLPALKRVHFYAGRLGVGVIDLMSGSFPDMDTLRLTQIGRLIRMPRSRRRSGPQVVVPPPRLHTLDFQNFCPTVLTFTSQWMARHPNANLLSTLHVQCPFVCTREAQPMFDLFGPLRLHSLHIGILTWMDGHKELHSAPPTTASLKPCTQLREFSITIQMYDGVTQEWPPVLFHVQRILQSLSSPVLEKLTIATRGSFGKPCPVDIIQELDWNAIQDTLLGKHFPILRTIVIKGKGDRHALTAFVKEKCPELYGRGLIRFLSIPSTLDWSLDP
ncbi:uncharacterized protein C8Q71DRAFT_348355 [Rhodofomes roseus]|uniref:F-box domain-containing protein n=1 Tax=Rhodofomes roseus TaxID=34475 RepID=A0ABQ8KT67_9APHY|nr:uncharacterized protein C8Q71DRAFT_348355 [Rhodofomes roseus]KAH9841785.1 hypothetical protein C8Q71DRAFT_348355 [Rhodofomes roseus]